MQGDFSESSKILLGHSVAYDGLVFHLLFGVYPYGGAFILIPNWSIGCDAYLNGDIAGNKSKMIGAGLDKKYAQALAEYINDWVHKNEGLTIIT